MTVATPPVSCLPGRSAIAIVEIIGRALDRLGACAKTKQGEERESLRRIEILPGLSFRQAELLKGIIQHPYRPFRAREVAGTYRVSLPMARHDLERVTQQGEVRQVKEGNRQLCLVPEGAAHDERIERP